MHSLNRRNTVPFYNVRRGLTERDVLHSTSAIKRPSQTSKAHWFPMLKRRCETSSCSQHTVTSTVTVTDCTASATTDSTNDITYIGPPLTCLNTSAPLPLSAKLSPPNSDCGRNSAPSVTDSDGWRPTLSPILASAPLAQIDAALQRDEIHIADTPPDWSRVAYYTSTAAAQATGLSFLANLGDPHKSGTFD
ncbi:hypothetical protein J1614_002583 [Plenodomus biglobosus]|nr:hypothetical protein J1614_002583 [Plenodomus biglobosus]